MPGFEIENPNFSIFEKFYFGCYSICLVSRHWNCTLLSTFRKIFTFFSALFRHNSHFLHENDVIITKNCIFRLQKCKQIEKNIILTCRLNTGKPCNTPEKDFSHTWRKSIHPLLSDVNSPHWWFQFTKSTEQKIPCNTKIIFRTCFTTFFIWCYF